MHMYLYIYEVLCAACAMYFGCKSVPRYIATNPKNEARAVRIRHNSEHIALTPTYHFDKNYYCHYYIVATTG